MLYAKTAMGVLARKAPQVAEYSQGLSRASTCVSLFIEYRVKDELCLPCIHGLAKDNKYAQSTSVYAQCERSLEARRQAGAMSASERAAIRPSPN